MNQEEKYKNFSCKICLEVANEPVITPCGHMYCWTCLYNWAVAKQPLKCPYCSNVFELNKVTTLFTGESKNKDIPPRPTNPRTEQPTPPPQQNQNNFNVSFGFGFPFMMFSTMNVGQVAPTQMRNVMLIFAVGFMLLNLLSYTTPTTSRSRHFEQSDNSNILWGAVMCAGFAGLSYFARKIMNP